MNSEFVARVFRLRKKPTDLCGCDNEEREHGVSDSVKGERHYTARNTIGRRCALFLLF